MSRITPFLWFNDDAEDAMNFYVSIFKDSEILEVSRYGEGGPMPAGTVMVASFRLGEQQFQVLNGGPDHSFTDAISFSIDCRDQAEVDHYWDKLGDGGEPGPCGWLKDRFGLSWQVVPRALPELLQSEDREAAGRVMQAMMQMSKIDVAKLQEAHDRVAA